jgi:hypothetical protein
MSYIGQTLPTDVFGGYATDTFAGDGSATTFTLSQAPFNEQGLIVVINNVIQQPTTNYTVSGTTLTIVGTAVASGDVIYARHTGVALPIGEANALDLQGQSDKLILDADADTTISADTDDQIDFKAGGTDIMSMTATGLTINDGVVITTADNTDTLTLKSTDADAVEGPNLILQRDSASPADSDDIARIDFDANNDAGEVTRFITLRGNISDASDGSEDAQFLIQQMIAGSNVNTIRIKPDEIVLNDSSIDLDFRVESNGNANMLFVDAGNDKVGIGTNAPTDALHIKAGSGIIRLMEATQVDTKYAELEASNGRLFLHSDRGDAEGSSDMRFNIDSNEAMRIDSNLNLGLGVTDPGVFRLLADSNNANNGIAKFNHSNATPEGIRVIFSAAAPDNTSATFLEMQDSSALRLQIQAQGNVQNHDNSYGQISDERIKQNITDANSQWNDIKALKVKNFERKDDVAEYGEGKSVQIGLIAQECEAVSPGLVDEQDPSAGDIKVASEFGTLYTSDDAETQDGVLFKSDDQDVIEGRANVGDIKKEASAKVGDIKTTTGEKVKAIKYSVLYMKAIKALQEAMAKIETLETKVKALEDA